MKRRKSPFLVFLTCVLAVPTCGVLMGEIPSEGVNFDLLRRSACCSVRRIWSSGRCCGC